MDCGEEAKLPPKVSGLEELLLLELFDQFHGRLEVEAEEEVAPHKHCTAGWGAERVVWAIGLGAT